METIPHVTPTDKVILFDGECVLCNRVCRLIIRYDKSKLFKLTSMQSKKGQDILIYLKQPTKSYSTMLLVEGERVYCKSTAFFRIIRLLPLPLYLLSMFRILPLFISDFIYKIIAENRMRFFGKQEQCMLAEEDHRNRYL